MFAAQSRAAYGTSAVSVEAMHALIKYAMGPAGAMLEVAPWVNTLPPPFRPIAFLAIQKRQEEFRRLFCNKPACEAQRSEFIAWYLNAVIEDLPMVAKGNC